MFHKVVSQHMQGLVWFLITTFLQMYYRIFQWKEFENRLRFDRIIAIWIIPKFLQHFQIQHQMLVRPGGL